MRCIHIAAVPASNVINVCVLLATYGPAIESAGLMSENGYFM